MSNLEDSGGRNINNITSNPLNGQSLTLSGTTPSSSITTGNLQNRGGFGNAGNAYFGGVVNLNDTTAQTGSVGALVCQGGIYSNNVIRANGGFTSNSNFTCSTTGRGLLGTGVSSNVIVAASGSSNEARITLYGSGTTPAGTCTIGCGASASTNLIKFGKFGTGTYTNYITIDPNNGAVANYQARMYPDTDSTSSTTGVRLGDTSNKWQAVYSQNGTIQTSDGKAKEQINDISYGLDLVREVKAKEYFWKDEEEDDGKEPARPDQKGKRKRKQFGLIGQDIVAALKKRKVENPGAETGLVIEAEDGTLMMNYSNLIPILWKSIQDLSGIISSLDKRIVKLEPVVEPTPAPAPAPTPVPTPTPTPTPVVTVPPSNKPVETPSNKPVEIPSNKPIEVPSNKPVEVPSNKPIEVPSNKPVEVPSNKPVEVEKPSVSKPVETPSAKPVESKEKGKVL